MALPSEKTMIRLYITHVDGEGHFLKISGQLDQQAPLMLESLFLAARENLEKGVGAVSPGSIHEGVICAAKYKDGTYYRAKVINTSNISNGLVAVHFIDYGNRDIISLSTIRFLDNYDSLFLQLRGQASDYYLSRVVNPTGQWDDSILQKLQTLLCYSDYPTTIDSSANMATPLISIEFKGQDLSQHLATIRFGVAITLAQQEMLLRSGPETHQVTQWVPSNMTLNNNSQAFSEHVPFLPLNQKFPSNPALAMRLQQNAPMPFNGSQPPPPLPNQKVTINKVSRTTNNLKAPSRQPQVPTHTANIPPIPAPSLLMKPLVKPISPKKSSTYKSKLLEANTQHKVFVSYAEEGPELFAVQLAGDCVKLHEMMDAINKRPHSSLTEPPMIGTVCLGRMSGDRIICRAIVMNLSGSQCKLFFVDFGDTEMVSYYDIFDIPEEFVTPNVFAMRFCLSGVKKLSKGPHLNETFKQLVEGKIMTLNVVSPEGPPLIQYGELYLNNSSVLDLLNMNDNLQFKWMEMLPLETKQSVLVSYVDSCIKFYIQLSDNISELDAVMNAVKIHCESSSSPGELPVGTACCARFPDDGNWYRARVRDVKGKKLIVVYVDYGNEQEVEISDLRTITPDLISLPAQALKCALKGFEDKAVESKTSNLLEMLALEKTLMANIVGVLANETMLVTLVDDTANPPLDVGRRMNQLSQPRSSHELKVTTPVRKDAPDTFSSPEENPDERKNFRREKSFKDDRPSRPPREDNPDFAQRGGSFRSRDNRDGFDRAGPGRHSEKFGGRQDRGERNERNDRHGPKPWERNQTSPPQSAAADDEWEESSGQVSHPPPRREFNRDRDNFRERDGNRENFRERDNNRDNFRERDNNRDNRDRRKPREDNPGPRNWKAAGGAGRRPRPEDSAEGQSVPRPSIQDRLKRDRYNQPEEREERNNDDWGNRNRDNRPPRENRSWGEKKESWGEKKDFGQKREDGPKRDFRDRGERSERPPRSNFSPRDRADRSFGSEKSFKSQDSTGRAPPFKPRSKFTQVQYKELSDPVALDTPFAEPVVELGAQHEVSVTWIITPFSFYTQILSHQPKFLEMMHQIPELYKGVKPYTGEIPVGSAVLARYPTDGVLYRATVVAVQPFSKFIVRYVDFGNKQLVDSRDIWQLERSLLDLPKMAVHCCLTGVTPKDEEWKADPEIDACFNAPRYQCVFQECAEEVYKVSLWNNGVSVADTLVEKQLAVLSEQQSSVTLKDEPIDMTIIVGQQIMCRVTHVESFDMFYIQLDLEKAALVEETIANYDLEKLTAPQADLLTDGIHCTVKHEDKVYRAIVQDVSDTANVKVVLPDYGNCITTSIDNIMILPSDLSVYYYQSLKCSLHNYLEDANKLMTLDELKTKLTGNKFIVYINDVDGITLVTTLYDSTTGQKVAIFEPDEGAYEEVVTVCMRAVYNYNFGVAYISHAENLNEIYLQKSTDGDRLALLLDDLYKFYEEGTPEPLSTVEVECACVVKSSDSNWYRATILSVDGDQVTVQFTDYGNSETLPKDSLKKLDAKFSEPCALALVVGLGLVALQDNALTNLIEWTQEKEVQVTLSFGNDGWLANLHLDGVDLSMKLINEKLATPQVETATEEKQEEPAIAEEPESLPSGCTQVYISHIDTPGHFWLQMLDKVDKIEEIQAELQANADSYPEIENREMGTPCIAKYLADEQWYRAEILDSDADITTVRFVDYGNTDVLDNQPGLIKTMPDKFNDIERYGVKASVNAVPTGTGEWSEAATELFTQLVGDLSAPVDALIVLKDITTYLDIYVAGQNLTDKLVAEGHASRSEGAESGGDFPTCFASHVNSPSEFWIQLESAAAELQVMEEAMVDSENFPELKDKEEGVVCAAKYPEDGAWYRAQVVIAGSEGTEVLFMDYGNASITNELRSLPDELKTKPALSRKCALQKPRDVKTWSRRSEEKFNELAAEGATIFNVQFIASGDISIVELYLEGKSVTEEIVGLCEEQVASVYERPTPVGQDLLSSGKVCYVESVNEFYVNLDSTSAELEKVSAGMETAEGFESISELKVGTVCAAFWSEDCLWYRAKVLEFCDVGKHVQFIDYGNKAKCEEFRQLPEEFAVIEPQAKCCRLAGVKDDKVFQENGKTKLDELSLVDETFKIEFLDSTKEPMLVKLMVNNEDVLSMISSEKHEEINKCESLDEDKVPEVPDIIKGIDIGKVDSEEQMQDVAEQCIQTVKTDDKSDSVVSNELIQPVSEYVDEETETNIAQDASRNVTEKSAITDDKTDSLVAEELLEPLSEIVEEKTITNFAQDASSDVAKESVEDNTDVVDAKELTETVLANVEKEPVLETESVSTTTKDTESTVAQETTEETVPEMHIKQTSISENIEKVATVSTVSKVESATTVAQETSEETVPEINVKQTSISENIEKVGTASTISKVESAAETVDKEPELGTAAKTDETSLSADNETDEFEDAADELNNSNELNESFESNHTIIENTSFNDTDNVDLTEAKDEAPTSPEKNDSSETLDNSNDTTKTPEREESKESITDTGYTSDDKSIEKDSPVKSKPNPEETQIEQNNHEETQIEQNKAPENESKTESKSTLEIAKSNQTAVANEDRQPKAEEDKEAAKVDLNKTV